MTAFHRPSGVPSLCRKWFGVAVAGAVSGGCVEAAVVTEALEVLEKGDRRMVSFGYGDDEAFAVGLTCGGTVHLFIEPLDW